MHENLFWITTPLRLWCDLKLEINVGWFFLLSDCETCLPFLTRIHRSLLQFINRICPGRVVYKQTESALWRTQSDIINCANGNGLTPCIMERGANIPSVVLRPCSVLASRFSLLSFLCPLVTPYYGWVLLNTFCRGTVGID